MNTSAIPKDFIDQYQKGLEAVYRRDVLRVAREHLHPEAMTIVAVGKTDEFRQALATLGLPISSIDLTIPSSWERPNGLSRLRPAIAPRVQWRRCRARQAIVGTRAASRRRSRETRRRQRSVEVAELHVDKSAGGVTMRRMDRWVAPSIFREDTTLPFGTVSIYGDGKTGWMKSPQGVRPCLTQLKPVEDKLLRLFFLCY